MATPKFKIVIGNGDWGCPMADQPNFETLEEAQAAARGYLSRQREAGGTAPRTTIEETTADGSILKHTAD